MLTQQDDGSYVYRYSEDDHCDFCLDPDPVWHFPAIPLTDPVTCTQTADGWAACDKCRDLIVTNQYTALARRGLQNPSAAVLTQISGEDAALAELNRICKLFRKARSGPPTRMRQ